jgi:hypothetical protein
MNQDIKPNADADTLIFGTFAALPAALLFVVVVIIIRRRARRADAVIRAPALPS